MSVNFRYNSEVVDVDIDERLEFERRMEELMSSFPSDTTACCCVVQRKNGVALHLVAHSKNGRFEGSVSTKSIRGLYLSVWNHFQPQLARWRSNRFKSGQRQKLSMAVAEDSPIKSSICKKSICPIFELKGVWPGQV